jgi:SH3-like domain-containing protein
MALRGNGGFGVAIVLAMALFACAPAIAADADTTLPVPRFASLRADRVNLRTGPGDRYPIDWVLIRKEMPVEITAQFEHWRRVRDWEGTQGWVHERMLAGKRAVMIKGATRALYRQPEAGAAIIARAEPGVVAALIECQGPWCRFDAGEASGWVRRTEIWGVYPDEKVQ